MTRETGLCHNGVLVTRILLYAVSCTGPKKPTRANNASLEIQSAAIPVPARILYSTYAVHTFPTFTTPRRQRPRYSI